MFISVKIGDLCYMVEQNHHRKLDTLML